MAGPMVPRELAVVLTHAELQAIAEDVCADLLQIKGPALHESLQVSCPVSHTIHRFSA